MLAAKASLAIRYDALGEGESNTELAFANRGKIENRLKQLEKQQVLFIIPENLISSLNYVVHKVKLKILLLLTAFL